jgi:hypothetical protein
MVVYYRGNVLWVRGRGHFMSKEGPLFSVIEVNEVVT